MYSMFLPNAAMLVICARGVLDGPDAADIIIPVLPAKESQHWLTWTEE